MEGTGKEGGPRRWSHSLFCSSSSSSHVSFSSNCLNSILTSPQILRVPTCAPESRHLPARNRPTNQPTIKAALRLVTLKLERQTGRESFLCISKSIAPLHGRGVTVRERRKANRKGQTSRFGFSSCRWVRFFLERMFPRERERERVLKSYILCCW